MISNRPCCKNDNENSVYCETILELLKNFLSKDRGKLDNVLVLSNGSEDFAVLDDSKFPELPSQILYMLYFLFKADRDQEFEKIYIIETPFSNEGTTTKENLETVKIVLKKMDKLMENVGEDDSEIIMDIAPGVKMIGLALMLWGIFRNKDIYYKHERQEELLRIPRVVVNWDTYYVDNIISTLNSILDSGVEPSWTELLQIHDDVAALFNFDNSGQPVAFYDIHSIKKEYSKKRNLPFGYGEQLLKVFRRNPELAEYIESGILEKWNHMWIGDQIPETVEHSQRHSKRLMDFLTGLILKMDEDNFFAPFGYNELYKSYYQNITYKDLIYFLLIVSINVHDLGHTYPIYKIEKLKKTLHLDSLPSLVRDVHNELTVQLLDNEHYNVLAFQKPFIGSGKESDKGLTLTRIFGREKAVAVKKALQLISKYHRGYLAVERDDESESKDFAEILGVDTSSLESLMSDPHSEWYVDDELERKVIKFVVKWLKFIDATDVQADRIVTDAYHFNRLLRTKNECLYLIDKYQSIDIPEETSKYKETKAELLKLKEFLENEQYIEAEKTAKYVEEKIVYPTIKELIDEYSESVRVPEFIQLADKIAFKARQFSHFDKHKSVRMVYAKSFGINTLSSGENGRKASLGLQIVKNSEVETDEETLKKIEKDIREEFEKAKLYIEYKSVWDEFELKIQR